MKVSQLIREQLGLSQEIMAYYLGITKSGVTTFEWTNYLRPYAVTLQNGKTEKNL